MLMLMQRFSLSRSPEPSRMATRRVGFSLVEVLFAVMILGVGFIMIAAIFPAALLQTQATGEETNAAIIAKTGANYLGLPNVATDANMPLTNGKVQFGSSLAASVPSPLWEAVKANVILPDDPRYAWVPLYRRSLDPTTGNASFSAQIFVIAVQARNRSGYSAALDTADTGTPVGSLVPNLLTAQINLGSPDTITFSGIAPDTGPVAPGAFVIVADDKSNTTPPGQANGYIYRVGNYVSGTTWELAPGGDTQGSTIKATAPNIQVWVVGRELLDPKNPTSGIYSGPAQDIAVYTTFVQVH